MAEDEDKSSKTEEPSERKLQKAKEQGNVPKSRELNTFAMFMAILLALFTVLPMAMEGLMALYGTVLSEVGTTRIADKSSFAAFVSFISQKALWILMPTMLLLLIFAFLGGFLQTGPIWSAAPIAPKLSKISLIKGLGRMFSMRSLMEFIKSFLKMCVVGTVLYLVMYANLDQFLTLMDKSLMDSVRTTQVVLGEMLLAALVIAFILGVMDYIFQRQQYMKEQRMSRREIKDEYKETEGDPHVKGRQRQIRLERARARMMKELPTADVVVTNPTHYAVALRYDKEKEAAPRVIAMGVDFLALKIREMAKSHDIPLYEDPPLARQLYAEAELNEEIPLELYEAVAKVVAYIYNLNPSKKKKNSAS